MTEPTPEYWREMIEQAAEAAKFEFIVSENPEREREQALATADNINFYVNMLDEAGYGDVPGWVVLEFLAAIVLSLYKALGIDVEI